jgi:ABC transporter substrate binding protein (PQQ-dependent alcohol dehydrogenase system)
MGNFLRAPGWRDVLIGFIFIGAFSCAKADDGAPQPVAEIKIGYLHRAPVKAKLSLLDIPADNDGLAGLQLALEDSNTTGQFLNQKFVVVDRLLKPKDDPATASLAFADQGVAFIIADLDATALLAAADAGKNHGQILINATAIDDRLREEDCRANVIHVAPTRSMLTDGLAQYLVWKKWRRWLLVVGSHPADKLLGDAYRHSAQRFGAKIVAEREFTDTGGARRTDSGIVEIQREIPVFTQEAPDYDALVAADESEVFAGYLPYRTWDARLVAGSAGLTPVTWNGAFDQWGAIQLQNRFAKAFHRAMSALDMQTWTAGRLVAEAAARTQSSEPQKLFRYILGPDFSLAAFKGQKLTLRPWNLQLRQPILLFDGRNTVSVSPQEGFLHQVSELDTLGIDQPETKCTLH